MNSFFKLTVFLFFIAMPQAKAAIVYRDIPDGIPSGLDFNADGTNEFTISNDILSGQGTYITYSSPSNIYSPSSSQWDVAAALDSGFSIGPSGNWFGVVDCTVTGNSSPTSFPLNTDKYLGFKINLSGTVYYGWARVYVTTFGTGPMGTTYKVTYKDYAYENTPNTAITAGAGILNLEENHFSPSIILYPNPTSHRLIVDDPKGQGTKFRYRLVDNSGRLLWEGESVFGDPIDISPLKPGAYFITIAQEGGLSSKSFLKTD